MDNSIVPVHLVVKAMRDNGYKNASYAIAELIDNSIQHGAKNVELLCSEIEVQLNSRIVPRVNNIAVLDNGNGMDKENLRIALQFGNGTNLTADNQKGIGKFGMGLPSSSISQAKKVEVWTWKKGVEKAIYSFLDIDEISSQKMTIVPEPIEKKIPEIWLASGKVFGQSGTLVVWSKIDKCIWKKANAIIENSEFLIGRMYRKFIKDSNVKIEMKAFNENNPSVYSVSKVVLPNDPIYLMENTSCPEPFSNKPMFDKWGDDQYEIKYTIKFLDVEHDVTLRFTFAKPEARQEYNPGDKPWGKHAAKNIGVSIVRAKRELDLDQAWVIQYDTRERWWGVEIEFPPSLDEIFGVTNNKQFANNFSELGKIDLNDLVSNDSTFESLKSQLEEEGDPKSYLLEIANKINNQLSLIRGVIRAQKQKDTRPDLRYPNITSPEYKATEATKERTDEGHTGTSDTQESKAEEENRKEVTESLKNEGVSNPIEVVDYLFRNNLKYSFITTDIETPAFFSVRSRGGKILISLNTTHPAYHKLVEVLDESTEGVNSNELRNRLSNASDGLKLLLMAWARYEDEQPDGKLKEQTQQARQDWGRIARKFLRDDN